MALDLAVRDYTNAFREQVATWSEEKLRDEGEERGIPEADTIPLVTLREAIVQDERDRKRANAREGRQLATGPGDGTGNPGT